MTIIKKLIYLILFVAIFQLIIFLFSFLRFIFQHFIVWEANLLKRYGKDSYVIITGGSSGQGKQLALKMAERGI